MPVGVGDAVAVRVVVAVRVTVCEGVGVGTDVSVGVGVGVDDGVTVAVAEAVALGVRRAVRVGVLVPFGVRVMVGDGLGVGVHGAAKVEKMSARIGMKSRSKRSRPRNDSAPRHAGNFDASTEAMIAAQKSAALPRPSQFASAISGIGVGVGVLVRVGVGVVVGVHVRVGVRVSVGARTGVLCATAAVQRRRNAETRQATRNDACSGDGDRRCITSCTRALPILDRCAGTVRRRTPRGPR